MTACDETPTDEDADEDRIEAISAPLRYGCYQECIVMTDGVQVTQNRVHST